MSVSRLKFLVALVSMSVSFGSSFAAGKPPAKVAPDAAAAAPSSVLPVIIQYKHNPGATDLAKLSAAGGQVTKKLRSVHGVAAQLPQSMLQQLASDDNVAYISPDRPVKAR